MNPNVKETFELVLDNLFSNMKDYTINYYSQYCVQANPDNYQIILINHYQYYMDKTCRRKKQLYNCYQNIENYLNQEANNDRSLEQLDALSVFLKDCLTAIQLIQLQIGSHDNTAEKYYKESLKLIFQTKDKLNILPLYQSKIIRLFQELLQYLELRQVGKDWRYLFSPREEALERIADFQHLMQQFDSLDHHSEDFLFELKLTLKKFNSGAKKYVSFRDQFLEEYDALPQNRKDEAKIKILKLYKSSAVYPHKMSLSDKPQILLAFKPHSEEPFIVGNDKNVIYGKQPDF